MFNALKQLGRFLSSQDDRGSALVQLEGGRLSKIVENADIQVLQECNVCINRAPSQFQYQLAVLKSGNDIAAEDSDQIGEELVFLIHEAMKFHRVAEGADIVFKWQDAESQWFKYAVNASNVGKHLLDFFETVMFECMFELKYQKSHDLASVSDLEQFRFNPQKPSPKTPVRKDSLPVVANNSISASTAAVARNRPEGEIIATVTGNLHAYNTESLQFVLLPNGKGVTAEIMDCGDFNYWFLVSPTGKGPVVSQPLDNSMNPFFSEEHCSFVWNYNDDANELIYSWSLVFSDQKMLHDFRDVFSKCMYEALNKEYFKKLKEEDQKFLTEAYGDVLMSDAEEFLESEGEEDEFHTDEESHQQQKEQGNLRSSAGVANVLSDDDDDDEKYQSDEENGGKNSLLSVGYKHHRSFVVRGSKIGVFSHDHDNVKHSATINAVKTPKGQLFSPAKMMLHNQDSSMILMNPETPGSLYKMDLETAKVVEEWNVDENRQIVDFTPDSKYAQMTPQQTFVGLSHNALFRIDPRQSGKKLVESQLNQYKSKNEFRCSATTGKGELVVASDKGDLRLYNNIEKRAKTHLPGLGDPIVGVDVTEDGKWILATCKTYLLLMPTDGDSSTSNSIAGTPTKTSGFQKSLGANKPTPVRLQLKPEHVAWINEPISFTAAKFNTGDDLEKRIVTSTGSYVITWNLRRVKSGHKYDYSIKKYPNKIVADNFRYGSDRKVIVTLPDDVTMVSKNELSTPKKMFSTPVKSLKNKENIVNSPYY